MKIKDLVFLIKELDFNSVLEYIAERAQKSREKTFITSINSEIIMLAREDNDYEKVLKSADLALCDSIGVLWAGKIFGKKIPGRVHGSDLLEKLSELASRRHLSVGYLGGGKNVALRTAKRLQKRYPDLKVAFSEAEWYEINVKKECDILFVAFGSPKQEKWIFDNLPKINVKVALGVGGAFDYTSGKVKRAPKWIRSFGLEWLFRLIMQPWRVKRQSALIKFVILVIKEKIFG